MFDQSYIPSEVTITRQTRLVSYVIWREMHFVVHVCTLYAAGVSNAKPI